MNTEIVIFLLLFLLSSYLIWVNLKYSLMVLLVLSVLLHKELFSIYRWDVLPVRVFMIAFVSVITIKFVYWFFRGGSVSKLFKFIKDPFVLLLILLWLFRGISIVFTKNVNSSIFLFGFFTTMVILGLVIYKNYINSPDEIIKFIRYYIYIVFGLSLIAFVQLIVYAKYKFIFGAFWNIPGHISRVGSLFWDVNHFGGLLAGLLPVLGTFILIQRDVKGKLFYFFLAVPMGIVLALTNSRTSWISAFVSFTFFITILLVRKMGYKAILYIILVLFLISTPLLWEYSDKSSSFRAGVKQYFHYRIDSFNSHFMLIKGSWQIFEKYPYLGGGYGSFFEHFSKTKVAAEFFGRDPAALNVRVPAHTIWGEVLAETGAVGFVTFSLFILAGFVPLLYIALNEKDKNGFLVASGMVSAIVGWLTAGIFYSYNSEFFWLVFFFYFIYGLGYLGRDKWARAYSHFFTSEKLGVILLVLLASTLVLINLGKNHLLPWDEAIYANISRNMVSSGEYMVQNWIPGRVWYEKPPMYMWFMALSMKLFGVSSFSARFPSAVFGIGTIILVYFFGKKLFNRTAGFIGAFSLLTTFNFLYYSRTSMLDVTTSFFIVAATFSYWLTKENKKMYWWLISGLLTGLAVMVKGVVGLIPFGIVSFYEAYLYITKQQKLTSQNIAGYLMMLTASVAVFLPWHLEMYRRFGFDFINKYIGYHVVDRAVSSIEDKGRPFLWYVIVMKVSMRIWFIALIPALLWSFHSLFKKNTRHAFLVIWTCFIFLLFSAATSKLKWYIIPIYPAAALIVGSFIEKLIGVVLSRKSSLKTPVVRGLLVGALMVGGLFYLFADRELVYETDLTGPQALLLEKKDREFGAKTLVYADRIDLPLLYYYTKGPFEIVDFSPLRQKLELVPPGQEAVFITKISRFETLSEKIPNLVLVSRQKEWVLGIKSETYKNDDKETK